MADVDVDVKSPPAAGEEAIPEEPTLTFHGSNGVECEDFINKVRCHALDEGKSRDNDWLVTFAKSCCRDGALEFLDLLDDNVKSDWKQLRKAFLKKYPAPLWREHSSVLSSPLPSAIKQSFAEHTPAAAPIARPPTPPPPPKPLLSLPPPDPAAAEASFRGRTQGLLLKGHIKAVIPVDPNIPKDSPRFEAYIAKPLNGFRSDELILTSSKSQALLLGYFPSQQPYAVMSVLKCKCGKDCMSKIGHPFKCSAAHGVWDFLSVSWTSAWPSKEATSATFCAVDTYTTEDIDQLAMWRVAPGCVLTPVKISSGVAHHAKVFVKPKDSTIRLETKLSVPEMQKLGYGVAELHFEPLNVRP